MLMRLSPPRVEPQPSALLTVRQDQKGPVAREANVSVALRELGEAPFHGEDLVTLSFRRIEAWNRQAAELGGPLDLCVGSGDVGEPRWPNGGRPVPGAI